jgi:hypothetical protein
MEICIYSDEPNGSPKDCKRNNLQCGYPYCLKDQAEIETTAQIPVKTLKWWRELVDLNPQDLAPRLDQYIKQAETK